MFERRCQETLHHQGVASARPQQAKHGLRRAASTSTWKARQGKQRKQRSQSVHVTAAAAQSQPSACSVEPQGVTMLDAVPCGWPLCNVAIQEREDDDGTLHPLPLLCKRHRREVQRLAARLEKMARATPIPKSNPIHILASPLCADWHHILSDAEKLRFLLEYLAECGHDALSADGHGMCPLDLAASMAAEPARIEKTATGDLREVPLDSALKTQATADFKQLACVLRELGWDRTRHTSTRMGPPKTAARSPMGNVTTRLRSACTATSSSDEDSESEWGSDTDSDMPALIDVGPSAIN